MPDPRDLEPIDPSKFEKADILKTEAVIAVNDAQRDAVADDIALARKDGTFTCDSCKKLVKLTETSYNVFVYPEGLTRYCSSCVGDVYGTK